MIPLVGHEEIRAKLAALISANTLPASLLLHGPARTGKERLALWMAQRLLCATPAATGEPCGTCQHCVFVERGVHPDLHWYFPRPSAKENEKDAEDVAADFAEAIETRLEGKAVWAESSQTEAIYVHIVKALVKRALLTPALANRKVIVVADAHRLVAQEGSDDAANAFLKLLEEPGENTTIILTSSVPMALLPTIRSRVVKIRIPPLPAEAVRELATLGVTTDAESPARKAAAALLDAARAGALQRYRLALGVGSFGARGKFTDTLGELTALLHQVTRNAALRGEDSAAVRAARAIELVEHTKRLAHNNVSPQLLTATLLDDLAPLVS